MHTTWSEAPKWVFHNSSTNIIFCIVLNDSASIWSVEHDKSFKTHPATDESIQY